ncbi:hypothetical protein SETIT_7G290500v2 [Setaria italica]|uniref:Uncharacterized protein n=2 Tax=Setaria TaxID=4554 RepID=A0A368S162_SETIT|nr:hypothetical protein SETIT_7G290500v2 [Setaria italica]TKW07366.1 hypothetical protein SEVIR_7G301700v2 [Setaria viridis]
MKSTGFHVICLPQSDRSRLSLARFHFRFIPWSLPLWLSRLGRHFWVTVLPYFCSTRVTGPAVLHCVWSLVMVRVFQEPADLCCFDRALTSLIFHGTCIVESG